MIKRLLAATAISTLLLVGTLWLTVSPVNASPLGVSKFPTALTSASIGSAGDGQLQLSAGEGFTQLASQRITPQSASFDSKTPHEVALNIDGSKQINLTSPITLSGALKDVATGQGLPNKVISFSTFGVVLGQVRTDDTGAYKIQIKKDLPAGKYQVSASFKGAHMLTPATSTFSVEVLPATLKVVTVPAVPGITFQMDGQQFVSGQDGTASVNVNQSGQYRLDVLLDQYNNPSEIVKFGRWAQDYFHPYRDVQVPSNTVIQVGLNIYHKVSMKFVDLDGFPVDTSRISSISIRSIQGDVFTLKPGDTPWLPASRTTRTQVGLEQTNLLYSVNSVIIDGSNVVNSAQQRFFARLDDNWSISLLLYSLQVSAHDALFASPTGTSVEVVFPDGQSTYYPLNQTGRLDIHALARGIYHVNLIGSNGMGTSTPVALSRNQVVNLNIITRMDMAVFGIVSVSVALGLIIYGRPWLVMWFFRRKRSSRQMGKDFGS